MRRWLAHIGLFLVLLSSPALSVQPDEVLTDPALESRARALSTHFRCLVCQNQSIDDSDAPLARDLRILIREQLVQGKTDEQVTEFVVGRYGDFVLLRPPFRLSTLVLWLSPFVVLGVAAAFLLRRRQRAPVSTPMLTPEEERELDRILRQKPGTTSS